MSVESMIAEARTEIDRWQRILASLEESSGGAHKPRKRGAGKRKMSEAGRKKIAAAQKARWAKIRADKKS